MKCWEQGDLERYWLEGNFTFFFLWAHGNLVYTAIPLGLLGLLG